MKREHSEKNETNSQTIRLRDELEFQEGLHMRLKNTTLAAAAVALAAAPVAIQAQAADRAAAPAEGAQELGGGSDGIIAIVAVAVLAAFIALTASDDDDLPVSP